jgi:hypothetical protein
MADRCLRKGTMIFLSALRRVEGRYQPDNRGVNSLMRLESFGSLFAAKKTPKKLVCMGTATRSRRRQQWAKVQSECF